MGLHSYIFGLVFACVSYVVYQKHASVYSSIVLKPNKRYDYIIVGAGTTGCVLAARLSEDTKTRVLLIEAGDHMGYFTKIPLTPTAAQQGPNDWAVRTSPQKYSSFGLWNQTQFLPRGKGLGGSGQINFLLHGFGMPEDFSRWTLKGFTGWTLEDLKPYFVKAFGTARSDFDSEHCSLDGYCPAAKAPMRLKLLEDDNRLMRVFKEASDLSKDQSTIFRKPVATIRDGERYSSYDAYLKPALTRRNLHVLLNTQAVSIRFENKTATSVYILQNHRELNNIFVQKEVVVAAGAIKAPHLLILSGVGPREALRRLGITPVAGNDLVGSNLHDHTNVPLYVSVERPVTVTLAKVFAAATAWEYFWGGKGLLAFPPVAGVEYRNQSALMLFSMGTASERLLRDLSNYQPQVFRSTFPFYNDTRKEGFMFLATCTQPVSRGSVTVQLLNTTVPPVVDPSYLKQRADVECVVKAMRRAEELVASKPFQEIGARVHWPRPERCLSLWNPPEDHIAATRKRTNLAPSQGVPTATAEPRLPSSPPGEYLECVARTVAVTGHHAGGTCAGGGVVDNQLRVKHVSGVRVMDASVLPTPVSLYPNSVLIAMAERAADIIRGAATQRSTVN